MFADRPVAIIDIGSNSVRLVVYSGATRIPSVIFNEKVMAGLGRGVEESGTLSEEAMARALAAMRRFAALVRQMKVVRTRTVATAAVREAANGAAFLAEVRALGLAPEILSGEEEGRMAGQGVLSAIPDADGLVGDLGGGSLELVEVGGGRVTRSASLPLGVLRLDPILRKGEGALAKKLAKGLKAHGFAGLGEGRPFYMVGGSWRALARLDMLESDHPLPITHQHVLAPDRPRRMRAFLESLDKARLRNIPSLSVSRVPTLPAAAALLAALADGLRPSRLVVSSFGIREGLLYDALGPGEQARDPLIEAAREAGAGLGRFAQHGELLDAWIAPAFDDTPRQARLRLAACLLADIAWAAHPDFRAERGVDMALHGNWVAVDAPGRVMLAQALFSSFGGGGTLPYPRIAALCGPAELERAARWGLAIRLGQRLGGGVSPALERSRLLREPGSLVLELAPGDKAMYGEAVERRLRTLAAALSLRPEAVAAAG
jgi:exopolyphosphatase / guanosine-5'-triphosphate,3'-diphosphate pyrophosphatase